MSMRLVATASLLVLLLGCRGQVAEPASGRPTVAASTGAGPSAEAPPSEAAPEPLSGIGIRPIIAPHGFAVGQVFPGGPAERAGLRVGDVVTGVDGASSARWTLERVAQRLRGPAGSNVTLRLERGGVAMQMNIRREVLREIPEVPQ